MTDRSAADRAPDERLGFWAKCRACGHCWIAAHFPADIQIFASRVMKARCPECGDGKPVVAKQENGQLLEDIPA